MVDKKFNMKCKFCNGSTINKKYGSVNIKICKRCKIAQTTPAPDNIDYSNGDFQAQFKFNKIDNLDQIWQKSIYKQINILKKYLSKGSKILEIGCGQGITLYELKKEGYLVSGIEPSKEAVKRAVADGLDVVEGYFPDVKLPGKKFDAIISSHVFEHVKYPILFINKITKLLSRNGLIMFTQTNYQGLIPLIQKENWYAWATEQHYWHFSEKGLVNFLAKNGYSHISTKYTSLVHPKTLIYFISNILPKWRDQFHLLVKNTQ